MTVMTRRVNATCTKLLSLVMLPSRSTARTWTGRPKLLANGKAGKAMHGQVLSPDGMRIEPSMICILLPVNLLIYVL